MLNQHSTVQETSVPNNIYKKENETLLGLKINLWHESAMHKSKVFGATVVNTTEVLHLLPASHAQWLHPPVLTDTNTLMVEILCQCLNAFS